VGVLLLLAEGTPRAEPAAVTRAVRHLKRHEPAKAIRLLEGALEQAKRLSTRARIQSLIGIACVDQGKLDLARAHFKRVLELDATVVTLPPVASREAVRLFAEVLADQSAPRAAPAPAPAPAPPQRVLEPSSQPAGPTQSLVYVPAVNWPGWIALGTAVGTLAAAITFSVLAQSADSRAQDVALGSAEASRQHDLAGDRSLTANILWGAFAATSLTSAALFLFYRPTREHVTFVLAPTRDGFVAAVRGITW